jgi:hypothetical protein
MRMKKSYQNLKYEFDLWIVRCKIVVFNLLNRKVHRERSLWTFFIRIKANKLVNSPWCYSCFLPLDFLLLRNDCCFMVRF